MDHKDTFNKPYSNFILVKKTCFWLNKKSIAHSDKFYFKLFFKEKEKSIVNPIWSVLNFGMTGRGAKLLFILTHRSSCGSVGPTCSHSYFVQFKNLQIL